MQETAHSYFHLDAPVPEGATLYAGPVLLKGWATGRGGNFITDLRARVGDRIFPVFYGHPRYDVAQFLGVREPFLPAGFEVELLLGPGENTVEFEQCTLEGVWRPLAAPRVVATPAQPVPWRSLSGTVHPHELARALRLVLRRAATVSLSDAAAEIAGALPIPFVTRYPALPFHGHLHQPPLLERVAFGRLIVEGWLFHETEKVRRVAATADLQAWTILEYGREQPYVAGNHPQFPHARLSRLEGFVDVPQNLPQPLSIRLFAELPDGTWHLCHVQRSHLYHDETIKAPYPRYNPITFARAVFEFRRACARRALTMTIDRGFWRAVDEVWDDYRARAPRRKPTQTADRLKAAAQPLRRVLLATHNLRYEGAPLFLLEFARHLRAQGAQLHVVSAAPGPLAEQFAALNATIQVLDLSAMFRSTDHRAMCASLPPADEIVGLKTAELVVANTLSSWWGVHLANRAGKPSLFYIHESTTPDDFYHGHLSPSLLAPIKESFSFATHVSFLTAATQRYYAPVLRRRNHSINPGWIDCERIASYRRTHPRAALRSALGLAEETRLVINVGAVCDRKGQHMFARAVDLLWRRDPALAATCRFLIVGGRETAFDEHVKQLLAQLARDNLNLVAETPDPYSYYGAADLFVCSSYEESFPRVILEAMAFELPIVSSSVHGIPEMARDEREAQLVPPGDPAALATAMAGLLADADAASRLGAAAAARVAAEYDSRRLCPHHVELAAAVAEMGNSG